jgi:transposase
MPAKRTLELTDVQRQELEQAMRHDPKPYMRATAILKVAAGQSGRSVAQTGLLHPRRHGTLYDWLNRYDTDGLSGLRLKPGRGRKPAFSPTVPDSRRGA